MFALKVACFVFVIPLVIQPCESIKCWVCRSDYDSACADPFDNTTTPLTDCNKQVLSTQPDLEATHPNYGIMCRKIKQKVEGVTSIIRDCGPLEADGVQGDEKKCTSTTSKDGNVYREICVCSKDLCNNSHKISVSHSFIAVIILNFLFVF